MAASSNLFKPLKLGRGVLSNRIALAPLTRLRCTTGHVPIQPLVSEYYAQRACVPGTLLISEATLIAPQAAGYADAPGIWSDAQIDSWKKVTAAVHANKCVIYMQLWALGRAATLDGAKKELGDSAKVVSASDIPIQGRDTPVPLTEDEIWEYAGLYAQAARNAVAAGFDGIELHGANGYLIDQFLQDVSNKRTDQWGGSVENRARFAIEVTRAVAAAIGADRTGIRLSPFSTFQGMKMADPHPQFSYVTKELKKLDLAYLHLVEPRITGAADIVGEIPASENLDFLVDIWDNQSPVLLAGGYRPDSAVAAADVTYPDKDVVIVFGRYFISNPDLVFRVEKGIAFEPYERDKFYIPGSVEGYTTYPFSPEFLDAKTRK